MADPVSSPHLAPAIRTLGRYEIIGALARGGMGTVYLARHSGEAGFQRLYAIKVMHAHLADDAGFVEMLLDEARLAAMLHHPNVVPIVDLGSQDGAHYVVMEYVEGCALSALLTHHRDARPPRLLIPLMLDALSGLHAAHVLTDDAGTPMNIVHRDVSPHNVLVGVDGTARITDFGVAKARSSVHNTQPGQLKGKLAFMSPEHFRNSEKLNRRSDIFSAGAMLWSALTGRKLFLAATDAETLTNVLNMEIKPPSTVGLQPPAAFDAVCLRALERDPEKRFNTALEMEEALHDAAAEAGFLGSKREVAAWVAASFEQELADRRTVIRATMNQMGSRPGASSSSTSSVSGFRMLPSLGPSTPARNVDSSPSLSDAEGAADGSVDVAFDAPAKLPARAIARRRNIAIVASLAALGIGVAATLLVRSGNQASTAATIPTAAASAIAPLAVASTVTVLAIAPAPAPAPPSVTSVEPAAVASARAPAFAPAPSAPSARPSIAPGQAAAVAAQPPPPKPATTASKPHTLVPDEF